MSASVCDFTFLKGVKVVDFTQFEAGPSCTEALGWLGADVVKIENPKMGDPGRRLRPGQSDTDPYYFHAFNANKKSITVNLKSPRGLELVKDMIRKADVMIENFAPGAIERLGLSYDVVKVINPSIIYAQVKGFGEGGRTRRQQGARREQRADGTVSVCAGRAERLCLHHDQQSESGPLGPPTEADRSARSDWRHALPDPGRPRRARSRGG